MPERHKISKTLSGVAGEYFVAAELSRRGFIASITLRNTQGVDILASGADAIRTVGIQVKTNQGSGAKWMLNKKAETLVQEDLFYVFVNLNGLEGLPTFHVVPSEDVAAYTSENHAAWLSAPGRGGRVRKDTPIREFRDLEGEWIGRWDLLGLE